jgi:uncharacterized protein (DUF362 family)
LSTTVAIHRGEARAYSDEWRDGDSFAELTQLRVLSALFDSGGDNLFRGIVEPGQSVVIKPNWVLDQHPYELDLFSIVTHSAVLRAIVDLVFECLQGDGTITIADAPQWNCNFENLLRQTEVEAIRDHYRRRHSFEVEILDLRQVGTTAYGFVGRADRVQLPGDPRGYVAVDLGEESAFIGLENIDRIYGADYDRAETRSHHNASTHEYLISKTILGADTFIHVPKLKVHKKVGVTLNAKGMVGINGNKNWIAHYRVGPPSAGGDEFPDGGTTAERARKQTMRLVLDHLLAPQSRPREIAFGVLRRGYHVVKPLLGKYAFPDEPETFPEGGNWWGNDTAWRMTADLARIARYAGADGTIRDTPQRRFVSVVDGIVAGELEGPLQPTPKPCGVLLAGESLLGVDIAATRLMGLDWRKIRSLQWLVEESPQEMLAGDPAEEILIRSNVEGWERLLVDSEAEDLAFRPHPQWVGHVELDRRATATA